MPLALTSNHRGESQDCGQDDLLPTKNELNENKKALKEMRSKVGSLRTKIRTGMLEIGSSQQHATLKSAQLQPHGKSSALPVSGRYKIQNRMQLLQNVQGTDEASSTMDKRTPFV